MASLHRLLANGANERRAAAHILAWRSAVTHFQDPLIYLLLAAIAIALARRVACGVWGGTYRLSRLLPDARKRSYDDKSATGQPEVNMFDMATFIVRGP